MRIIICSIFLIGVVFAQQAPTIGEIYDFEIGDEFHYHRSGFERIHRISTVIDKEESEGMITYTFRNQWRDLTGLDPETYDYYTETSVSKIGDLDSVVFEWANIENDTTVEGYSLYHDVCTVVDHEEFGEVYQRDFRTVSGGELSTIRNEYIYQYAKGIGRVLIESESSQGGNGLGRGFDELVYYKKMNGEEAGKPLDFSTGKSSFEKTSDIRISQQEIVLPDMEGVCTVYNLQGEKIETIVGNRVSIGQLSAGTYVLHVTTAKGIYARKFVRMN